MWIHCNERVRENAMKQPVFSKTLSRLYERETEPVWNTAWYEYAEFR